MQSSWKLNIDVIDVTNEASEKVMQSPIRSSDVAYYFNFNDNTPLSLARSSLSMRGMTRACCVSIFLASRQTPTTGTAEVNEGKANLSVASRETLHE